MNAIRRSIPCPASKLGPRPSQSLSPFQLAPGTRALDTHKGARELASSVPAPGQGSSSDWAEKAGRALEPSLRAAGRGRAFGRERRAGKSRARASANRSFLASSPGDQPDVNSGERKRQPSHSHSESQLLLPQGPSQPSSTARGLEQGLVLRPLAFGVR